MTGCCSISKWWFRGWVFVSSRRRLQLLMHKLVWCLNALWILMTFGDLECASLNDKLSLWIYRCWRVSSAGMALALAFDGRGLLRCAFNGTGNPLSLCTTWPCSGFYLDSFFVLHMVWLLPLCSPVDICLWWNWLWHSSSAVMICWSSTEDKYLYNEAWFLPWTKPNYKQKHTKKKLKQLTNIKQQR